MKRRDLAAVAVAAVVVGAAGLRDWAPAPAIVPALRRVAVDKDEGPERLRMEILEKLRGVRGSGERNLFRYVEAAPVRAAGRPTTRNEALPNTAPTRQTAGAPPVVESLPLKFYGFAKRRSGDTRALFYDEEFTYLAAVGDVIGGRYRVLRIAETSAEVEDLTRHTRETLAMEPDAVTS
jgi:hypothetical protein